MQMVSGSELATVARLSDLCVQQAKTRIHSTESLLHLPQEVLRDLCGIPSKHGRCIVLINDTPLESDANIASGAICGYHVLRREFLFGEYQANVFLDPLENAKWKSFVQLKEIVPFIRDFDKTALDDLNETSCYSNRKDLTLQNGKWIEALLHQQVARWVLKNNCYFALKLTDEFLKLAQKETIKVRMMVH